MNDKVPDNLRISSGPSENVRLRRGKIVHRENYVGPIPRSFVVFDHYKHPRWLKIKLPTKLIYSFTKIDGLPEKNQILERFLPTKPFDIYLYQK